MKTAPHLTYCLNVHPGEAWQENLAAIQTHAVKIRDQVSPEKPFGLGLRLSHQAALTLTQPDTLAAFKRYLLDEQLYAFTINGFPYGSFHTKPVKTTVYQPDWTTRQRLDYTLTLARILAAILPDGTDGSISTVPLGYKYATGNTPAAIAMDSLILNLAECACSLHELRQKTGKEVHIGLEPEPDCILETTQEVITFFEQQLIPKAIPHLVARLACDRVQAEHILRRHIGICFDTCHLALQFEPLADSLDRLIQHGIRISKVQLSAALEVVPTAEAKVKLSDFLDPVYLHQVKARPLNPTAPLTGLTRYADLDEALTAPEEVASLWRIHFHLPLYYEGRAPLQSTANTMDLRFWQQLAAHRINHLEIETYTFHVLPPELQAGGVAASTLREYQWVASRQISGC